MVEGFCKKEMKQRKERGSVGGKTELVEREGENILEGKVDDLEQTFISCQLVVWCVYVCAVWLIQEWCQYFSLLSVCVWWILVWFFLLVPAECGHREKASCSLPSVALLLGPEKKKSGSAVCFGSILLMPASFSQQLSTDSCSFLPSRSGSVQLWELLLLVISIVHLSAALISLNHFIVGRSTAALCCYPAPFPYFDSFLITEVAESGKPAARFYYTWALKCCRLREKKWKMTKGEGRYWSRLSELPATFKLLWTSAGTLPASDGFNSLLHCSPQPLLLYFSSFLASRMAWKSVCCVSVATGSGLICLAYEGDLCGAPLTWRSHSLNDKCPISCLSLSSCVGPWRTCCITSISQRAIKQTLAWLKIDRNGLAGWASTVNGCVFKRRSCVEVSPANSKPHRGPERCGPFRVFIY